MAGTHERRGIGRQPHTQLVLIERSRERPLERRIREQEPAFSVDHDGRLFSNERSEELRSRLQRRASFLVRETLKLAHRGGALVHLLANSRDRESCSALDAELEEQSRDVGLHCLFADPHLLGDRLVRSARDDALKHLAFTWGDVR